MVVPEVPTNAELSPTRLVLQVLEPPGAILISALRPMEL